MSVGIEGTVIRADSANGLRMFNLPNGDVAEILAVGQNFTVIGGPACWTIQTFAPGQSDFRMWRIRTHAHNAEAWVHEYEYIVDGGRFEYNLRALQTGPGDQDPIINAYTVDPATAAPGAAVTVGWDVRNASSVNLQVFDAGGQSLQRYDSLNVSHSMNYTVPQTASGTLRLVLTVIDTQGRTSISQERSLTIPQSCQFASRLDPNRCPVSQVFTSIVTQSFERGTMLWRSDSRKIYVFYGDGSFQIFDDTWDPSQPPDTGEAAPDGLLLPGQGFGKVWNEQAGVRDRLGWATAIEASMNGTFETYDGFAGTETYLTVPNGRVLILSGSSWRVQ
jgi:hypothetical protein